MNMKPVFPKKVPVVYQDENGNQYTEQQLDEALAKAELNAELTAENNSEEHA